ncbi:MAG: hypothetical protein R2845_11595 [Thermomicrobiales bacterium]
MLDVFRQTALERGATLAIEGIDWQMSGDGQTASFADANGEIGPLARIARQSGAQRRDCDRRNSQADRVRGVGRCVCSWPAAAWLPGSYEVVPGKLVVVIDGAHSPASARALADTVRSDYASVPRDRIAVVFGMLKGKNAADCLRELEPINGSLNIVPIASPRSMPVSELAEVARSQGADVRAFESADEALASLRNEDVGLVVVTGSLALAAEARVALGLAQPEVIPHAL